MKNYIQDFQEELENIGKLVETPDMIKRIALSALENALRQDLKFTTKNSLSNTKKSLENIADSSIKENYKIIYSQMCILAVSSLEALLKRYFLDSASFMNNINLENEKLTKIKITAVDLLNHNLDYTSEFGNLLLEAERASFQDLKSIKETFESYLKLKFNLKIEEERLIIYYLELRHVLVHRGGRIDKKFVDATTKMNANFKNYKPNDLAELDHEDWEKIESSFLVLASSITSSSQ
jgi:hypothetical protein